MLVYTAHCTSSCGAGAVIYYTLSSVYILIPNYSSLLLSSTTTYRKKFFYLKRNGIRPRGPEKSEISCLKYMAVTETQGLPATFAHFSTSNLYHSLFLPEQIGASLLCHYTIDEKHLAEAPFFFSQEQRDCRVLTGTSSLNLRVVCWRGARANLSLWLCTVL